MTAGEAKKACVMSGGVQVIDGGMLDERTLDDLVQSDCKEIKGDDTCERWIERHRITEFGKKIKDELKSELRKHGIHCGYGTNIDPFGDIVYAKDLTVDSCVKPLPPPSGGTPSPVAQAIVTSLASVVLTECAFLSVSSRCGLKLPCVGLTPVASEVGGFGYPSAPPNIGNFT